MIGQIRCRACGTGDGDCLTASVVDGEKCCQECEHRRRWVDEDVQVARHGHLEGWRVAFALFVVVAALLFALTDPFVWSGKDLVATVAIVTVIAWAIR